MWLKSRFRQLIKDAGYRFVKAENGRAVLASREAAAVDLLEYLRDVYRYVQPHIFWSEFVMGQKVGIWGAVQDEYVFDFGDLGPF